MMARLEKHKRITSSFGLAGRAGGEMFHILTPGREHFKSDPLGYSALAHLKWGMACEMAGFQVDLSKPATAEDLKNPILWMSQANALSEAAVVLFKQEPNFSNMPESVRGICDSQYCAIVLMLVGYSLEISLKAMMIIRDGVEKYIEDEKNRRHHRLHQLAEFIPDLSDKEVAILKGLTHFVYWAGRYPDPGSGRIDDSEEIFSISEKFGITAGDVFALAGKIMKYSMDIIDG
ncbi:HEPN domain-containing protein [Pedomonas mirosovicensis]|uniref:HEPN domain-containing protein n=1 Tax=Pedomonas mirosovicensis TaxID=2908641 RepID=UPI002168429C|nr:HEPN domain-containing protein [Pedomonas mirosovicensis]MCH8685546.1 HEPN domain-containing protein [Pedomonas mirosovicensis]